MILASQIRWKKLVPADKETEDAWKKKYKKKDRLSLFAWSALYNRQMFDARC